MKFGNIDPDNFKVGDRQVDRVMQGNVEVWNNTPAIPCEQVQDFSWSGDYVCDTEHFDMGIGPFSTTFHSLKSTAIDTVTPIGIVAMDIYIGDDINTSLDYIAHGSLSDVTSQYDIELRDGNFNIKVSNSGFTYSVPAQTNTYYHVIYDFLAKKVYLDGRNIGTIVKNDSSCSGAYFGSSSGNTFKFDHGSINKPIASHIGNITAEEADAMYVEAVNARKINDQLVNLISTESHTLGYPVFRMIEDGSKVYTVRPGQNPQVRRYDLSIPERIASAGAILSTYDAGNSSTEVSYGNRAPVFVSHDGRDLTYCYNKSIARVNFSDDKLGGILVSNTQTMATTIGYYPYLAALFRNSVGAIAKMLYKYKSWSYVADTSTVTDDPMITNAIASSPIVVAGTLPGSADMSSDGKRFYILSDGKVVMHVLSTAFDLLSADAGTTVLTGQSSYAAMFVKQGDSDEFYISTNASFVRYKLKVEDKTAANLFYGYHNYTYTAAYAEVETARNLGIDANIAKWYRYSQGPTNVPSTETSKIVLRRKGKLTFRAHHFNWDSDRASVKVRMYDVSGTYLGYIENSKVINTWSNTDTTASFLRFYDAAGTLVKEFNGSHFAGTSYGNGGIERIIDLSKPSEIALWSPQTLDGYMYATTHYNKTDIISAGAHGFSEVRQISIEIIDIQSNYSSNNGEAYFLIGDPDAVWDKHVYWYDDPKFYVIQDKNLDIPNTSFWYDGVRVGTAHNSILDSYITVGDYRYAMGKQRYSYLPDLNSELVTVHSIAKTLAPVALSEPLNLLASDTTYGAVTVTWDEPLAGTAPITYDVYENNVVVGTNVTSPFVRTVGFGQRQYKVRATNSEGFIDSAIDLGISRGEGWGAEKYYRSTAWGDSWLWVDDAGDPFYNRTQLYFANEQRYYDAANTHPSAPVAYSTEVVGNDGKRYRCGSFRETGEYVGGVLGYYHGIQQYEVW